MRRNNPVHYALAAALVLAIPQAQAETTGNAASASAPSIARRTEAAGVTALKNIRCIRLEDFYWEVGDKDNALARGWVGNNFIATTDMEIGSSGKWVFGAYALEKMTQKDATGTKQKPDEAQMALLTARAGYPYQDSIACMGSPTVGECLSRLSVQDEKYTSVPDEKYDAVFSNSAAHAQKLAVDLGMGDFMPADIAADYARVLDPVLNFYFILPVVADGMSSSPAHYGAFLRLLLSDKIEMARTLGAHAAPVAASPDKCTTAGAGCLSEIPVGGVETWQYAAHYWVESGDDGDGAYSHPGEYGFYPWIDRDKKFYGMVARKSSEQDAGYMSYLCGREIRAAWETGIARD